MEAPKAVTWARGTGSDTVEVEVNGDFYGSDCIHFSGGSAARDRRCRPGFQRTGRDDLRTSGPIAIGVLLLLLVASLYSWTVILGKMSAFSKATKQSRKFIRAFRKATRLQEIAALTSEYSASPLAQVFEDVYETYKRHDGRIGTAAQPGAAGAHGADRGQRSGDRAGAAHDVAGDDRERPARLWGCSAR